MEELFRRQGFDLLIDPVQERFVAFADSGSDGILTAQGGDADGVTLILKGEGNDLGIVVRPGDGVPVFQSVLRVGVGIVFLEGDLRIVFDQRRVVFDLNLIAAFLLLIVSGDTGVSSNTELFLFCRSKHHRALFILVS